MQKGDEVVDGLLFVLVKCWLQASLERYRPVEMSTICFLRFEIRQNDEVQAEVPGWDVNNLLFPLLLRQNQAVLNATAQGKS